MVCVDEVLQGQAIFHMTYLTQPKPERVEGGPHHATGVATTRDSRPRRRGGPQGGPPAAWPSAQGPCPSPARSSRLRLPRPRRRPWPPPRRPGAGPTSRCPGPSALITALNIWPGRCPRSTHSPQLCINSTSKLHMQDAWTFGLQALYMKWPNVRPRIRPETHKGM